MIISAHPWLRRIGWILPTVLAGLVAWSGPCRADDRAAVTAASDSAHTVIRRALADEDSGRLASVFTEDGAVISPTGQVVQGRLTIRTSAALLFLTLGGGDVELTRYGLNVIDSTAYETGRYDFRRADDETPARTWSGRYTAVWKKEGGRWKVACAIGLR